MARRSFHIIALLLAPAALVAQPTLHTHPGEQMRINLAGVNVTANGTAWNITAPMIDDNNDSGLPSSFRRWWHFEVSNLNPATGETLHFSLTNAGYSDIITPVWSLDGGQTYQRVPGIIPSFSSNTHTFTINTPAGHESIRLSKYFPYTLPMFEAYRASINSHPFVEEEIIGTSVQGRNLYMYTITDTTVSDVGKKRVWIHSAVHPSENTAYFNCEGLIDWLTSGDPEAGIVLRNVIFNIVPMANPDGVHLGNYRTNANSVNLENEWTPPYNSTVPEIVAMRTKIEEFMGTASTPGENPITVLLNLHATHGGGYPYHFVHRPSYNNDGTGVIPEVRDLEDQWVAALRNRNAYYALSSSDAQSTLSGRVYVESMMHDRYTLQPEWEPVMAITFEGVYQLGPGSGPNTDQDYRQLGADMGLAIADYYGIDLTTGIEGWMLF